MMPSNRIHGIVIHSSKFSESFWAVARTAKGEQFLIKTPPPAGVYYTPPTTLSFQATGSSAPGPDGLMLPLADSVQLTTSPLSNEIAPFIKGVVRKSYDAPGRAHLFIDHNEDNLPFTRNIAHAYTSLTLSGAATSLTRAHTSFLPPTTYAKGT